MNSGVILGRSPGFRRTKLRKEVAFKALLKEDSGSTSTRRLGELLAERDDDGGFEFAGSGRFAFSLSKLRTGFGGWRRDGGRIWFPRWALDSEGKLRRSKSCQKGEVTVQGRLDP
ncbi:hypothetical protein HPP92_014962 [Vanilla planifolia]|uniref:Uncharacterized protein n=1 Tax=Vanilla planifolia TaxID=51239 RepID=A0A835QGZ1_VANPL|nr:hypothetical protein HPP92_014962 [Vanilla planifolia]